MARRRLGGWSSAGARAALQRPAFSTPLMVTLARTVYALDCSSADPAELLRCPSREAIEERLLDTLVPALYARSSS